ncbi:MAG: PhzF family phenazine biosynthesis protein [Rubrivivax sp.]|jgi:PhzF family phenazine biosynthesis protein|nr:PhzF family phenazine biosynthesis protein [Rubrivivax sp.]
MHRRFAQVDVFTAVPLYGNPLAVVLDGSGLDDAQMARLARWTQLSETTFLLPPTPQAAAAGADYRVRIFFPQGELPFAGHPTLGSCHAWLAAGGRPQSADVIVQECGVGLVRIRRSAMGRLAFAAPPRVRSDALGEDRITALAAAVNLPRDAVLAGAWCDNGPGWEGLLLDSAERVLAARPDASRLAGIKLGLVGRQTAASETQFEVRAFFPGNNGVAEDPVTGSLNAALAQWLVGAGIAPHRYVAAQGTAMGRAGRVHVDTEDGQIWIGGDVVPVIDGSIAL